MSETLVIKTVQAQGQAYLLTPADMLSIGASQGVMEGDRFDILEIPGEIVDPVAKEALDVYAALWRGRRAHEADEQEFYRCGSLHCRS